MHLKTLFSKDNPKLHQTTKRITIPKRIENHSYKGKDFLLMVRVSKSPI